jgi:hypothetical protein
MIGRIVKVAYALGVGIIESDDGRKLRFQTRDVMNTTAGLDGQDVDFLIVAGRPKAIIVLDGSPWMAFGGLQLNAAGNGGRHVGA